MALVQRPRWYKIFSDLWSNRARSLLVVASITVGLFALGVISTIYAVISEDMRLGYAAVNPANITILSSPFEQELVDHIENVEGVREAEGTRVFGLRLESHPDEWISINLKAFEGYDEMKIDKVHLEQGRYPEQDDEIAIERYKLDEANTQVGAWVNLELPSGKFRQMKVVGIVHDQTIGATGSNFFLAPVQGFVLAGALDWLEQPDSYNQMTVTIQDGDNLDAIQAVSDRVRDKMEEAGQEIASASIRSSYDHPNRIYVDAIVGILFLLGLLIVFLSGFLITNTLQALLNQQMEQIGIMKTVGGRRGQIAGIYLILILVFGLLAFLLAAPLAYEVSFRLLDFLSREINFSLRGQRVVLPVIGAQLAIALIMPTVAALAPILQGTRISIQEALSGIRQSAIPKRGWLDRQISRKRLLSRPNLLALRNVFRRKGRLLLTLTTLTLGGAVFISTFNVQVSMKHYTDQVGQYFLADVNVILSQPARTKEIAGLLEGMPGFGYIEGWASANSELVLEDGSISDSVQMLAPPSTSTLVKPVMIKGRWVKPGDRGSVVLNEQFMSRFPNLQPGDPIRLRVSGEESDWTVLGFFQLAGKSAGYLAYTDYDSLARLIHEPTKAYAFRVVSDRPDLTQEEQEALGRAIEARLKASGIQVREITAGHFLSSTASDGFAILTDFLLFLAVLTALVGSIGLAGTMSMNVLERTREIGVMRAIGASDPTLLRMVLIEGLVIGFLSWLLGSILAFPISKLLSDSISQALFNASSTFALTPTGFVLWLVLAGILSVLASVMPARHATRLTIREVLAYE